MSFDILQKRILELENPAVVGLDPAPGHIPPPILERHLAEKGETLDAAADAVLEFNRGLIDALWDIVPAVKPQSAFYEMLGHAGVRALEETCRYARSKGLYVILDAKRGDIGSTAEAYSAAYLGGVTIGSKALLPFECDALTVNAYLGSDGLRPFLGDCVEKDKAVFALVKTSNPSGAEVQDLPVGPGRLLYDAVGELLESLAGETAGSCGYTRIGAVVGATYPRELGRLRARLRRTFFLVPGYGAQGGGAADVADAFDPGGRGAVVNSSRAIICAWKKTGGGGADYAQAARNEALRMRGDLRAVVSFR